MKKCLAAAAVLGLASLSGVAFATPAHAGIQERPCDDNEIVENGYFVEEAPIVDTCSVTNLLP